MAFRDNNGFVPRTDYFYNVEQAVGPTGVNNRSDVYLVQYLLKGIWEPHGPTVDGWIGPQTNAYIKAFQKQIRQQKVDVAVDGRVDRALSARSSVSKTAYTILAMNHCLRGVNPKAYELLPARVPLNAQPLANPYNPPPGLAPGDEWGDPLIAGGPYIVAKVLHKWQNKEQYVFVWSNGAKTEAGPVVEHNY